MNEPTRFVSTSACLRLAALGFAASLCITAEAAVTTWTSDPHGPGTIEDNRILNDVWWSGAMTGQNGAGTNLNANDTLKVDLVFGGTSGLQLLDDGLVSGSTESLKIRVAAAGGTLGTLVDYKLRFTGLRGDFQHANPIVGTLNLGAGGSVDFNRDLDYVTTFGDVFFTDLRLELTPRAGGAWTISSVEIGLDALNVRYLKAAPPEVPEPRSVVLMLVGFGLIAFILRRRRRSSEKRSVSESARAARPSRVRSSTHPGCCR